MFQSVWNNKQLCCVHVITCWIILVTMQVNFEFFTSPFTFDKEKHNPYSCHKTLIILVVIWSCELFLKILKKKTYHDISTSFYCASSYSIRQKRLLNNFIQHLFIPVHLQQKRILFMFSLSCINARVNFTKFEFNISSKLLIFQS